MCQRCYTKRRVNNQKVQKYKSVLNEKLRVKNAPKLSAKYLKDKNMEKQTNTKHSCDPKDIFKSAENFLGKLNTKEDSNSKWGYMRQF